MSFYPTSIARCQHIKVNGTLCGSPALNRRRYCFFHQQYREQTIRINTRARRQARSLNLPVLEDANSIQITLMQVMRLILTGQIDSKVAGLLLYALQTASVNLKNTQFEPRQPENVVIDPKTVADSILGEQLWDRNDYEDEEEDEAAEEDEADDEEDSGEDSEAEENDEAEAPKPDPYINHPVRVAMRANPRLRAAIAEAFSIEPDDPYLDSFNPDTIGDRHLKEILAVTNCTLSPPHP